jgi:hypothetical protein
LLEGRLEASDIRGCNQLVDWLENFLHLF